MKLFRILYSREGMQRSCTIAARGLVPALELAARLAARWHFYNWTISQIHKRR